MRDDWRCFWCGDLFTGKPWAETYGHAPLCLSCALTLWRSVFTRRAAKNAPWMKPRCYRRDHVPHD